MIMSPTAIFIKLKCKASCLCNTKAALYFSHCNSVVELHNWTQIMSFVSKNGDEFSLEEAAFSVLTKKNHSS